ncbi:hypothetical protein [Halobacillus yeomjeoni]|uniref:Uncharacterized protein n=1 Tax=Halobacillus yeomjeoni TaxID=311194 RepID=A0A931MWK3_9BACI|nr:hypothetical protein [Halobacillus yeomjeoni]MBH0231376.1 hypothetical protein [Halobacillus yeomjeoni]
MWKDISKKEADKRFKELEEDNFTPKLRRNKFDHPLREHLLEIHENIIRQYELDEHNLNKNTYLYDFQFGLRMYSFFNSTNEFKMSAQEASSDGIWRHISLYIIPDIVFKRWGSNDNRFYKNPRRIWVKTLWWYVFLSWQGNQEDTEAILRHNTTDDLVQLVERAGSNGYRIDLSREIMKYYGSIPTDSELRSRNLFRKVMKLNTAKTNTLEPGLIDGGIEAYVRDLFGHFVNEKQLQKQ